MGSGESSGRGHHTRTATRGTKRETTAPGPPADEDGPDHRSRTGSRSRTEPERGRARPTPRSDRLAGGWASSGRRSVVSTWGSSGDLDTPVVTAGRWAGTAQSVAAGPVTAVKRFRARRRPALPVGGRGVPAGPGHSSRSAVRRPPCRRLADQSHGLTGIAGTDPAGRRAECDVPAAVIAAALRGPRASTLSRSTPTGPVAEPEMYVIPGAGHSLNVHRSASAWFSPARM